MVTNTLLQQEKPQNPFRSVGDYSDSAIELMRAMSAQRKQTGRNTSTPSELMSVVAELGYQQPANATLPNDLEIRRFVGAMTEYQQQNSVAYPTCDNVLHILGRIGYFRLTEDVSTVVDGVPIDRRRREEDDRSAPAERRSNPESSPQEKLDLTQEEHNFLDALKSLREKSGRQFAASEELLSIAWDLGYRPVGLDGLPMNDLKEAERCEFQIAYTRAVEAHIADSQDTGFLTARKILNIVQQIGFQKQL